MRNVSRAALQEHAAARRPMLDDAQTVVGCGRALIGERIAIVDPDSAGGSPPTRSARSGSSGPNVARAYWRNAEATHETACNARDRRRGRAGGCAPATSAFSTRPANCSSPAGSRISSSSAASTTIRRTSSTPCRR